MRHSFGKLNRNPGAYGVTGLHFFRRLAFVEKNVGFKDRKENQLCDTDNGQSTPYVEARHKYYEKYVNDTYLFAEQVREKEVEEAEKLITELMLIVNYTPEEVGGNEEEISRSRRLAADKATKDNERKEEIILKLSEIKSFLEVLDNKLSHHIEAAGDLMDVHVANYWRGVLKASKPGEVRIEPVYITKKYEGRQKYYDGRDMTLKKLMDAIMIGGGTNEETE